MWIEEDTVEPTPQGKRQLIVCSQRGINNAIWDNFLLIAGLHRLLYSIKKYTVQLYITETTNTKLVILFQFAFLDLVVAYFSFY